MPAAINRRWSPRLIRFHVDIADPGRQVFAPWYAHDDLHAMRLVVHVRRLGRVADAVAAADVSRDRLEILYEVPTVLRKVGDASRELRQPFEDTPIAFTGRE